MRAKLGVRMTGALLAACALSSFAAGPTPAGKNAPKIDAPDLEFLEYLGTLESDGENWTDVVNVDVQSRDAAAPKNGGKSNAPKVKPKADSADKTARNDK